MISDKMLDRLHTMSGHLTLYVAMVGDVRSRSNIWPNISLLFTCWSKFQIRLHTSQTSTDFSHLKSGEMLDQMLDRFAQGMAHS